jgi:hypothetical protein
MGQAQQFCLFLCFSYINFGQLFGPKPNIQPFFLYQFWSAIWAKAQHSAFLVLGRGLFVSVVLVIF